MKSKFKNIDQLRNEVMTSIEMQQELKNDPVKFFDKIEVERPIDNPKIFLIVVGIVGLTLFAAIIFGGILALKAPTITQDELGNPILLAREIPDFIIMLGSTALGALAGLLVPTPTTAN